MALIPKPCREAFQRGVRSDDLGRLHYVRDMPPRRVAGHAPQVNALAPVAALLRGPKIMHHVQGVEECRGGTGTGR